MRIVLLDSHALIHRAYHALPDFSTSSGEPTGALYGLSTMIMKLAADFAPDYLIACYDREEKTHRHESFKEYKGTRKKIDDALIRQLNTSKEIFEALNVPIYDKAGFEADDILGTIVEELKDKKDIEIIIASGDMDTLQLVYGTKVKVFTLKKGIKDTIIYDEKAVLDRFGFSPEQIPDYKGLRGDPSDNIPGIAGIGEKTATTLISTFGTIENMYKVLDKGDKKFKDAGLTDRIIGLLREGKEEALFSKMLATIRKDAPIDLKFPEKRFFEGIDFEKSDEIFRKYEFRTLGIKLKELLSKNGGPQISKEEADPAEQELSTIEQLMVSVVDPSIARPKMEDLLRVGDASDKKTAIKNLEARIKKDGLEKIFKIESDIEPVIRKMEKWGAKIDIKYLKKLGDEYHKKLDDLQTKIYEYAGSEFNINSPKQLGEVLFDTLQLTAKGMKKTAGGARSTKESELLKLKDSHPIISLILEYRELAKLLSTYIDSIPKLVDKKGRLHTHFVQIGAVTGRMASEDPNLQNIPNKTDLGRAIRDAFIPDKGFKFVSFDYSQFELRIAAFLSGDEKLISIFKDGLDVHAAVASQVFKVPMNEVTKTMRIQAKVINFGILYGMGINALKANLGSTMDEARDFYDKYFKTYSKLAEFLENTKSETAKNGYTTTFFGRRRYFPEIKSKLPFLRASAERMAINAPIQGTQADMIKIAMKKLDDYITSEGLEDKIHLIIQVHDELDFEISEDIAESAAQKMKSIMEDLVPPESIMNVPIVANASIGESWGKLKEIK